ncbi:hypothetical protein FHS21_005668 [Phyllobacterium trifolii]|uniref:Uncharacterized protein n=1 Tax=Phyllobacterium trifolii TaxID=300193 RepID=A0A839UDW5_9HYPH|nr:hypothetical protein [Phyllobacterium trifolii]MBB3149216.1 hypothetical protein [Phyllobacterium trifolii]
MEVALSATGDIGNPAMSQIVNAAIGYADALTARFEKKQPCRSCGGGENLARCAWKSSPAQAARSRSIRDEKDEAQYGIRAKSLADAESLLDKLEKFAEWVGKGIEI